VSGSYQEAHLSVSSVQFIGLQLKRDGNLAAVRQSSTGILEATRRKKKVVFWTSQARELDLPKWTPSVRSFLIARDKSVESKARIFGTDFLPKRLAEGS
jgi:hypothetical protein